nr:hypothetical protein [Bacilli bacterium]
MVKKKKRISERFNLNKSQFELDFVDITLGKDTPLFIDSTLINKCNSEFSRRAHKTLDDYFKYLIGLLKRGYETDAKNIASNLGEVNETFLGLSKNKPCGRGIGLIGAIAIFDRIRESKAIKTGYLTNIEDLRIFVEGIDRDKISDMITNIIRFHLLKYTEEQCELHNIPMVEGVASGYYWNDTLHKWENKFVKRLVVDGKPVLLVPKNIVSFCMAYTPAKYKQFYILNYLQKENIEQKTELVKYRKNEEPYVTKKSILDESPFMDKEYFLAFTIKHPEIFENFKRHSGNVKPLDGNLNSEIDSQVVCEFLIEELKNIPEGRENASRYHQIMIGIYELLLYPDLVNPRKEAEINDGRKRIDIIFSNIAEQGYFNYIPERINMSCPQLIIECKNYKDDLNNPELDQLAGRFSISRGQIGIASCRHLDNPELFFKRCADIYRDRHGFVIPITDNDIIRCLKKYDDAHTEFLVLLQEITDKIIQLS